MLERPQVGAVAYPARIPRRNRANAWALAAAAIMILAAVVIAGWMMFSAVGEATFVLPTPEGVFGRFPELALDDADFKGIWGEADRGTWIFEYQRINGHKTLPTLVEQMTKAGWTVVEEKPNEIRLKRNVAGTFGEHGVVRAKNDRLRILIMTGDRDAWGKPKDTALYDDPFYKKNVENKWRE